jgi:lipid-binding SYLF domain-containing protein
MKNISLAAFMLLIASNALAQSSKDKEIISDSQEAKASFIKQDPSLGNVFAKAYAFAIFPNVGKGGLGIGGAAGNGTAYEKGKLVGMAKMKQVTIGLQAGGQGYREVIFFENAGSFKKFKENNVEFSAQVSAVAASSGASANAKYNEGVMVFTMQKGGLMYEASVGGQKFKFSKL